MFTTRFCKSINKKIKMKYQYDPNRKVGGESRKTYVEKINNGFFDEFCKGIGIEIGFSGYEKDVVPILETAIGIEKNTPNYDGTHLPFSDKSQDYLYSSHVLEHISNRSEVIKEWMRVLKVGGYLICIVPHQDLYERKEKLPSKWNADHKVFYRPSNLLKEFEDALPINSFRMRHLKDNDTGHNYNQKESEHSLWCYEIELVLEKIK